MRSLIRKLFGWGLSGAITLSSLAGGGNATLQPTAAQAAAVEQQQPTVPLEVDETASSCQIFQTGETLVIDIDYPHPDQGDVLRVDDQIIQLEAGKLNSFRLNKNEVSYAAYHKGSTITCNWSKPVTPSPIPGANNDNKLCRDVIPGSTEFRVDGTSLDGTYTDGTITIRVFNRSTVQPHGLSFEVESGPAVLGAVVKDGVDGANFYDYRSDGVFGGVGLTTPFSGQKGVSHTNFCYTKEDQTPTETPATETPVTETPVTETPATETPVTETPVTETPVTETPATETPVTETPATETPVTETPATETPVTETPATETPVETQVSPACSWDHIIVDTSDNGVLVNSEVSGNPQIMWRIVTSGSEILTGNDFPGTRQYVFLWNMTYLAQVWTGDGWYSSPGCKFRWEKESQPSPTPGSSPTPVAPSASVEASCKTEKPNITLSLTAGSQDETFHYSKNGATPQTVLVPAGQTKKIIFYISDGIYYIRVWGSSGFDKNLQVEVACEEPPAPACLELSNRPEAGMPEQGKNYDLQFALEGSVTAIRILANDGGVTAQLTAEQGKILPASVTLTAFLTPDIHYSVQVSGVDGVFVDVSSTCGFVSPTDLEEGAEPSALRHVYLPVVSR